MSDDNYFERLNSINVSVHIEKKGGFSYLSWPYAVAQLRLADPTATWEVRRFDGKPYLLCEAGVFVEVAVTVQGITLSQIHPVLDGRNRPILEPNAFDINTSIQRCLVKAIALHGLGLYIYACEDTRQPANAVAANDAPPADDWPDLSRLRPDRPPVTRLAGPERISKAQQTHIHKLAIEVGISLERVLSYFCINTLSDITTANFNRVVRSLEKHRKAA